MMDDAFKQLRERVYESLGEDMYLAVFDAAAHARNKTGEPMTLAAIARLEETIKAELLQLLAEHDEKGGA